MKRILVVNVNWLGDAVLTLPIFEAIKKHFGSSFVAVMVPKRIAELFIYNPFVDEVIEFDEKSTHKSLKEKLRFIKFLKKKRFDVAFLLHRSFTKALILWLAGIRTRIGYKRRKTTLILTQKIPQPTKNIHRQDYYFMLFEKIGIKIVDRQPKIFLDEKLDISAKKIIEEVKGDKRYLIGINPSANWNLKRWPPEYFVKLADLLIQQLNAAVIFIGTKNDTNLVETITNQMKQKATNFAGKTTIAQLASLLKNLDLFISADSGPAHLSAALDTKTIVIFGPTSERITAPKGKNTTVVRKHITCKIPCYNLNCQDNICMKSVTVEDVFLQAKKLLTQQ